MPYVVISTATWLDVQHLCCFFVLCGGRAILKNDWNEVVDLILKPRPGGERDKPAALLSVT